MRNFYDPFKLIYYVRQRIAVSGKYLAGIFFISVISIDLTYSKNYYFSSSLGNDSYSSTQAQNPATPWKTISKLNSSMSLINPGDSILFKRGDVFFGQIILTRSGASAARIVFSDYGSGKLPLLKATAKITGWTRYNGNVWQADCPQLGSEVSNFFINGKSQQIGRYPNADDANRGYLNIDSHSGRTTLTSSSLTSSINWTGGEAVIRTRRWILDRVKIQSHQGNTLVCTNASAEIYNNYGFFIQNHIRTLDKTGEWYYNPTSKRIYLYYPADPNGLQTEATSSMANFEASNVQYVTIENLEAMGALKKIIRIANSNNIEIRNNIFSGAGEDAIYIVDSRAVEFVNNNISQTNNNAAVFIRCSDVTVTGNRIRNCALKAGMGLGSNGQYLGVFLDANNSRCEQNTIDSVGYVAIFFYGNDLLIKNNMINHFCMTIDDGGGIYTYNEGTAVNRNRIVERNIVLNGLGVTAGTNDQYFKGANGIYMDNRTNNVKILNNTVSNCSSYGICIHNANYINITGNVLFNNNCQLLLVHDEVASDVPVRNCVVSGNIFFSKYSNQIAAGFRTIKNDIPQMGTFNDNRYCRPMDDDKTIQTIYYGSSGKTFAFLSLDEWQKIYNYDLNSSISPYKLPLYSYNNVIGSNKLINGTFDQNVSAWDVWSRYNNGVIRWDNTNKLDQGSMELSFSKNSYKTDSYLHGYGYCNELVSGEPYVLRFSAKSSNAAGKNIRVSLYNGNEPYNEIANQQHIYVNSTRSEHELIFIPKASSHNGRIDYVIEEDNEKYWIDNVRLFRSDATIKAAEESVLFITNPQLTNKVFSIDGNYIDVKGTKYSGSLTLQPYSSVVLMVDPNPSAPPTVPVYVSSAIENATPTKLEMTYNLSLANIVPAASAFTVTVNSSARTVSSVAVSGTKVTLTLASPIAYGNTVTVAYNKPSSNPLQTAAGGQAATISAQSVTNKVAAPAQAPAPVPVYVSSAIENTAPSKLEMTYNLSLANIVPAASAFTVKVNSSARSISSVAVSGTKVVLTLSSPVAYGDNVTVSYTKPSSNPLQTTAGGQAATISAKAVTNRVAIVNAPPVVVVTSPKASYSGFVSEISAAGSYDTNKDNLTFSWTAQSTVPISSRSGSTIEFLAPIVSEPTMVQFTVKVSDGKATQTKVIPVEILPYKPELEVAEVVNVEASSYHSPNYPHNVVDGNIGTMWAANGTGEYLIIELKEPFSVQHVKLAFQPGQKKESYFDLSGSNDMEKWEPILIKSVSCDFSGDLQVFDFPRAKAEREYRYIKLTGQGNLSDKWNYISELRIYGYRHRNPESYENLAVKVYPNPASEVVNIRIDEPSLSIDFIRIVHLSGRTVYINNRLGEGTRLFNIPINLANGIYLIQMGKNDVTLFNQKFIVKNRN